MNLHELRDDFIKLSQGEPLAFPGWKFLAYIITQHIDNSVPLVGPPDKYARTSDGVLLAVGDDVYDADGRRVMVCSLLGQFATVDNDHHGHARNVPYSTLRSTPPEPQTLLDALRTLVDAVEADGNLITPDAYSAMIAARKVLDKQQVRS